MEYKLVTKINFSDGKPFFDARIIFKNRDDANNFSGTVTLEEFNKNMNLEEDVIPYYEYSDGNDTEYGIRLYGIEMKYDAKIGEKREKLEKELKDNSNKLFKLFNKKNSICVLNEFECTLDSDYPENYREDEE